MCWHEIARKSGRERGRPYDGQNWLERAGRRERDRVMTIDCENEREAPSNDEREREGPCDNHRLRE